ncbi:TfoX/Sxy family DNA transformation protein [Rhizobium sp. LjRoot254]|uniref:TfoX/Sxy family DNA transformation protein n=1 Tax=Rhizobium sp. LjRoot254 TaxID=3342297 RepID=UPI003ED0E978
MRNLGPKSETWLAEIDIHTLDDLRAIGAVEAYARLRFRFGREITRNMLHSMAAAIADIDWRQLSPEHKADLDRAAAERLARFNLTKS